jgi:hypothetical protein
MPADLPLWTVRKRQEMSLSFRDTRTMNESAVKKARKMLQFVFRGRRLLARDVINPVADRAELSAAQQLIARKRGTIVVDEDDWTSIFLTAFSILKTTTTLLAKNPKGEKVGASVLVGDGLLGLPADSLFKVELNELRNESCSLVEIAGITLDPSVLQRTCWSVGALRSMSSMMGMFSSIFRYAYEHQDATHIVVTTDERSRPLFEVIGFESRAAVSSEGDELVFLMALDIESILARCDSDIASLCLVAGFGNNVTKKAYTLDSFELIEIATRSPEIFRAMSDIESRALIADYPMFAPVLTQLRKNDEAARIRRSTSQDLKGDFLFRNVQ